jgi:DNA repair exonuclease SbcCD ATPase subunit
MSKNSKLQKIREELKKIEDGELEDNQEKINEIVKSVNSKPKKVTNPDTLEKKKERANNMRKIRLERIEIEKAKKAEDEKRIEDIKNQALENRIRAEILKQKEEKERAKYELQKIKEQKKSIRISKKMKELESEDDDPDELVIPHRQTVKRSNPVAIPQSVPEITLTREQIMRAMEARRW